LFFRAYGAKDNGMVMNIVMIAMLFRY